MTDKAPTREEVELGWKALQKEFCRCEPETNQVPCEYCALYEALRAADRLLGENERLNDEAVILEHSRDDWKERHQRQAAVVEEIKSAHETMKNTGNCLCTPRYGRRQCLIADALELLPPRRRIMTDKAPTREPMTDERLVELENRSVAKGLHNALDIGEACLEIRRLREENERLKKETAIINTKEYTAQMEIERYKQKLARALKHVQSEGGFHCW
jgi:hypothetical protein